MWYRDFYVKETQHNSTRVIATGPLLAWWVFLGKVIVLFWPLGTGPSLVSGWVGWALGIVGEIVWLVFLAYRAALRNERSQRS